MNKNLKRIIAMVLAVGTVSAISPATNLNLLTTKAYAADNDEDTLESLELFDKDGHTIKFYEDNSYEDRVDEEDVEEDETYYAKTSSKTVSVEIDGPSNKYVRIFNGTADSTRGKDPGDDIILDDDSSVTTLVIKIYGEDTDDDTIRNNDDDDDEYELLNTYKIKVRYIPTDDTDTTAEETDASDYDNIYLERLSIDGKMLDLKESQTKYVYNVDSDVDEVVVRATPEDEDDDDVTINGEDADYDENFKVKVDLEKGKNSIEIEVEDDGKTRVYTLIINRGDVVETTTGTTAGSTENTATKNKWIQVSGKWKYLDATGNAVRNTWIGSYYLLDNGFMATGWLNYGGSWYYLGIDGAIKTGWQKVDGIWYHLDSQGKIQIGWFKDINGKYYYLSSYGGMVYNTTVDGYRLGADGAWIGR